MTDLASVQQEAPPFTEFAPIARLSREMVVTEKIDGTNAQVCIGEDGTVRAGSRNRWLTLDNDNFGFARWVYEHIDDLRALGPGRHYGEWWGAGIQRRYGLTEKRFSLFNTGRWTRDPIQITEKVTAPPQCCYVVPVLLRSTFDTAAIDSVLGMLRDHGSKAAPGFDKPEGVIVYHIASGQYFKKTLDKNDGHKGK